MCAPWVTRHTSIRYSSSCHTRVNMDASIFFTAVMIRAFRSAIKWQWWDFDFFGISRKLSRTRSTSSSAVNGRPLDFCLHRHPFSVNCLYHARTVLSVGGSFAYFARNARCTVTTDLLCDIPTHKTSLPELPFSH